MGDVPANPSIFGLWWADFRRVRTVTGPYG
jgi:hypothetical protein